MLIVDNLLFFCVSNVCRTLMHIRFEGGLKVKVMSFVVVYGAGGGTAVSRHYAHRAWREGRLRGLHVSVFDIEDFAGADLAKNKYVLFILATGPGIPTDVPQLVNSLKEQNLTLETVKFAVLPLGTAFETADKFASELVGLRASMIIPKVDENYNFTTSISEFFLKLKEDGVEYVEPLGKKWDPELSKKDKSACIVEKSAEKSIDMLTDVYEWTSVSDMRRNDDSTYMTLVPEKSIGDTCSPGDVVFVFPENENEKSKEFIKFLGLSPDECICIKPRDGFSFPFSFYGKSVSILTLFTRYLDIFGSPQRDFFIFCSAFATDKKQKRELEQYLNGKNPDLEAFYNEERSSYFDVLKTYGSVRPTLSQLLEMIPPLCPRSFFVTSSPEKKSRNVDICSALRKKKSNSGRVIVDPISSFMWHLKDGDRVAMRMGSVPVLKVPSETKHVVLLGEGSGVIPLKGFVDESLRENRKVMLYFSSSSSDEKSLLFSDYISEWKKNDNIDIDYVLLRGNVDKKVTFEDLLMKHGKDLASAVKSGAFFVVCTEDSGLWGFYSASLLNSLMLHENISSSEASDMISQLEKDRLQYYSFASFRWERVVNVEDRYIRRHPVVKIPKRGKKVSLTFDGKSVNTYEGIALSSALMANGYDILSRHTKDKGPQGIFCANGQCSQCSVLVNGIPVKSCMVPSREGMVVESREPSLKPTDDVPSMKEIHNEEVRALVLGGGPAGMRAALELSKRGFSVLLVDDKDRLGGKLVLQTHKFFGTVEDCYAGTRGYQIGQILAREVLMRKNIEVWLNSTAVSVFSDKIVGIVKENEYCLVKPEKLLIALGSREKSLPFPGNTLPGVYGAGAFQTMVNRDLVRCAKKILIVGAGNVGIIAGYHALQAGIEVVAVVEALPNIGGYKVHSDKLMRFGVPILTRHTIVAAHGDDRVESVTIGKLDEQWKVIPGTLKNYEVDTLLIAVGLSPVDEFYTKAKEYGMDVYSAGDAQEIAEASAAMLTGHIEGVKMCKTFLQERHEEIPSDLEDIESVVKKANIMKSRPGQTRDRVKENPDEEGCSPVIHCFQEIPCDACTSVCPRGSISITAEDIRGLPQFNCESGCDGCFRCLAICPGLAITVVDYTKNRDFPLVSFFFEMDSNLVREGELVSVSGERGDDLGQFKVESVLKIRGASVVQIHLPRSIAKIASGVWIQEQIERGRVIEFEVEPVADSGIVCRCERVTAGEIRSLIRSGVRDMNEIKAVLRVGMGACGAKTCLPLLYRLFREEGVSMKDIVPLTDRPLFMEVPLGTFAGCDLNY